MLRSELAAMTLLALIAAAEAKAAAPCPTGHSAAAPVTGEFGPQGVDVRGLSRTSKPGDGFFNYVNEGWLNATTIPERYWDYGQTTVLGEKVDAQIRNLVTKSAIAPSP